MSQAPGKLILILGPSGAGKGTVFAELRQRHPDYVFPVSCTTRDPRPGEVPGQVYNFVTEEEFLKRQGAGEFLETAIVHGKHHYGTLRESILGPLNEGKVVIREVDVQGLRSIRELLPEVNLTSIFLTVDSWETLQARILRRSQISEDELARRHESFTKEMEWAAECDYVIENHENQVERLIAEVEAAIEGVV